MMRECLQKYETIYSWSRNALPSILETEMEEVKIINPSEEDSDRKQCMKGDNVCMQRWREIKKINHPIYIGLVLL